MYYDLIASLPQMPHFEHAERLPITPLRLEQRLRRLRSSDAEQLKQAEAVVRWRPERLSHQTDAAVIAAFSQLQNANLKPFLREYVSLRMTQRMLLAALRLRRKGRALPNDSNAWGIIPRVHHVRKNWNAPLFGLEYVHPWLAVADERLLANDAMGLERLMVELNWRWLTRTAEDSMFGFESVVAFVFKWDMLQAWLACNAEQAKVRFTELVDKVTNVENE